jgi:cell division protein FtsQ
LRPLIGVRRPGADPAPSRLRYRLVRLWRRRAVRRAALVQGPALAAALTMAHLASDPAVHAAVEVRLAAMRDAVLAQEAFAVRRIEVTGAAPSLEAEIRAALADAEGASSLDLDAAAIRARIEDLGWVARARVSLEAPEALRVAVEQRVAAAIWRIDGEPWLIDAEGARIDPAFSREDHPDLPLVAGPGAATAMPEALAILAAAGPLGPRIRGLVRVGERRWDVVLTEGRRILLPMVEPAAALGTAIRMQAETDLLDRAIAALDLRLPQRPTVRLTAEAAETLRLNREIAAGTGEDA